MYCRSTTGNLRPDLVNVSVDENGYLVLKTGDAAIDPNNIVIPFTQEVSVTFLYEGVGYKLSDFGWMLAKGNRRPKIRSLSEYKR